VIDALDSDWLSARLGATSNFALDVAVVALWLLGFIRFGGDNEGDGEGEEEQSEEPHCCYNGGFFGR
jgi:hypothetical protein